MEQGKPPFAGRISISPSEAAAAVFGWTPSTTRTNICRDDYPLPLIKVGGRKLVRVSDLIAFIESQPVINGSKKSKPGRPTKREQIERAKQQEGGAA